MTAIAWVHAIFASLAVLSGAIVIFGQGHSAAPELGSYLCWGDARYGRERLLPPSAAWHFWSLPSTRAHQPRGTRPRHVCDPDKAADGAMAQPPLPRYGHELCRPSRRWRCTGRRQFSLLASDVATRRRPARRRRDYDRHRRRLAPPGIPTRHGLCFTRWAPNGRWRDTPARLGCRTAAPAIILIAESQACWPAPCSQALPRGPSRVFPTPVTAPIGRVAARLVTFEKNHSRTRAAPRRRCEYASPCSWLRTFSKPALKSVMARPRAARCENTSRTTNVITADERTRSARLGVASVLTGSRRSLSFGRVGRFQNQ